MFVFKSRCPHCCSDQGFDAFGISNYAPNESENLSEDRSLVKFSLAGTCLSCKKPVVAMCSADIKVREEILSCIRSSNRETYHQVIVEHIFPSPVQHYSYPSLPEKINKNFIDLQKMLVEKKQPYLIILGCRSVLEEAVCHLEGEGQKVDFDHVRGWK